MMSRTEDEVSKLEKAMERHNKQVKQIEDDIPSTETQVTSFDGQIERLQEEMGTELTTTLSDDEQALLDQLKATQTRLDGEIDNHTQVLEDATVKRQKLQSLLEDNLIMRRTELTESSTRSRSGANNANVSQAQMKEDLAQKKRELEEAAQTSDDVDRQLNEVKATDEKLRAEIVAIKNDLEKLKTEDSSYQKKLEKAHAEQEKLLNKVSCVLLSLCCHLSFFSCL
jgi:chromosome segregation ATPase